MFGTIFIELSLSAPMVPGQGVQHGSADGRLKLNVLVSPFIYVHQVFPWLEHGLGGRLGSWINENNESRQGQGEIVIGEPFRQTVIFVHDQ